MTRTGKKGRKKAVLVVSVLLAVILLAGAGLYIGVTWNTMPEKTQEQREPSAQLLEDVVQGALAGTEIRAEAGEVNRYLAALGETTGHETLQEMVLQISGDDLLEVWLPVTYKWMHGTAYCKINLQYQGDVIYLQVLEARLGKLPLPIAFVLSLAKEKLPDTVQTRGDTIIVPTPRFSLEEQGLDVSVGLTDVRIEKGQFVLRTDSVTGALEKIMQGFLQQLFGG